MRNSKYDTYDFRDTRKVYTHPVFYVEAYRDELKDSMRSCAMKNVTRGYPIHFLPCTHSTCFPGNYVRAQIIPVSYKGVTTIKVYVDDGDDGEMEKYFATERDAVIALGELTELAPFSMADLSLFGYSS